MSHKVEATDSVELGLPQIVRTKDYHDFAIYQNFLQNTLGVEVYITELGFNGHYIGLAHLKSERHEQLILQLEQMVDQL